MITVVGTLAGVVLGHALERLRERSARAKLKFDDKLYLEPFEHSVRVSVRARHVEGKLPATNVMGLLTVEVHGAKLSDLVVGKKVKEELKERKIECKLKYLCRECSDKAYLASEGAEIEDEPLPWSVPISAGVGLDGLRYSHLTHISVGGSSLLRLFDVYWAKLYGPRAHGEPRRLEDEFWLVKVHSEYGTEHYPRICLRLPIKGSNTKLCFVIKLAGENVREAVQDRVILKLRDRDCAIEYHGMLYSLRQYFREEEVKPLELEPMPIHV